MSEQLLEQVREAAEGQIVGGLLLHNIIFGSYVQDFEGQRVAELLTTALLGATGTIAFLVGYMAQDIRLTLYVGLAGTALTFVAIVPPWPFLNKNPENWLPARKATSNITIDVDGKRVE